MSASLAAEPIPSSYRSLLAIARVAPDLMPAVKSAGFTWGSPLYLRVFKKERDLEVWIEDGPHYRLFRSYAICDYSGGLGPKIEEGDNQSPEGFYDVGPAQLNPESQYHLSFDLGFPNAYDQAQGRTGNALMVHGDCVSLGCFAMATGMEPGDRDRNRPIEEIWTLMVAAFQRGQPEVPVHVFPFRLDAEMLLRYRNARHFDFWRSLRPGYELFERNRRPPKVAVRSGRYVFDTLESARRPSPTN